MKKRYIILVILMVFFIAITPACFKLAYLERGYRAVGGERLVPLYGLILWYLWDTLVQMIKPCSVDAEEQQ